MHKHLDQYNMHLPFTQKKHTNTQTLEPCGRKGGRLGERTGGLPSRARAGHLRRTWRRRRTGRDLPDGTPDSGGVGAQVRGGGVKSGKRGPLRRRRRRALGGGGGREELGTGRRLAGGSSERRRVRRSRRRRRRRVGWGISRVAGEGGERRGVRVGGWKRRPGRRPNPRV